MQQLRDTFNTLKNYPYLSRGKQLILDTPIEVPIGAVAIGAAFCIASFGHENAKRGQIPLAFSEISQTTLYHQTIGGQPVPPLTRFYSVTNDVVMQVFEANNMAHNMWGNRPDRFAYELEKKVDQSLRVHTLISDYAPQMQGIGNAAREPLAPMRAAARDAAPVIEALDKAWDEDHDDVYRTEYYTEQECTGSGETQSCSMVTKSRQVYDYTIHTYDYDARQGRLAVQLLQDFMRRHPEIAIPEGLLMVTATNAENEWAMRESRRHLPGYEALREEDYLRFANTWATGSNYAVLTPKVIAAHQGVAQKTPQWATAAPRSRDHRYRTNSRSDSGPREFQVAEAALAYAVDLARNVNRIDGGIVTAQRDIPILNQKIIQYVDAVLHGGEGDTKRLRRDIMQLARNIYAKNYAGGFDTTPANWGMVVLWTVLGMAGGGGLGFGADRLITYLYQRRGAEKPRPSWQRKAPTI